MYVPPGKPPKNIKRKEKDDCMKKPYKVPPLQTGEYDKTDRSNIIKNLIRFWLLFWGIMVLFNIFLMLFYLYRFIFISVELNPGKTFAVFILIVFSAGIFNLIYMSVEDEL